MIYHLLRGLYFSLILLLQMMMLLSCSVNHLYHEEDDDDDYVDFEEYVDSSIRIPYYDEEKIPRIDHLYKARFNILTEEVVVYQDSLICSVPAEIVNDSSTFIVLSLLIDKSGIGSDKKNSIKWDSALKDDFFIDLYNNSFWPKNLNFRVEPEKKESLYYSNGWKYDFCYVEDSFSTILIPPGSKYHFNLKTNLRFTESFSNPCVPDKGDYIMIVYFLNKFDINGHFEYKDQFSPLLFLQSNPVRVIIK